jgi:hypothetical protein
MTIKKERNILFLTQGLLQISGGIRERYTTHTLYDLVFEGLERLQKGTQSNV